MKIKNSESVHFREQQPVESPTSNHVRVRTKNNFIIHDDNSSKVVKLVFCSVWNYIRSQNPRICQNFSIQTSNEQFFWCLSYVLARALSVYLATLSSKLHLTLIIIVVVVQFKKVFAFALQFTRLPEQGWLGIKLKVVCLIVFSLNFLVEQSRHSEGSSLVRCRVVSQSTSDRKENRRKKKSWELILFYFLWWTGWKRYEEAKRNKTTENKFSIVSSYPINFVIVDSAKIASGEKVYQVDFEVNEKRETSERHKKDKYIRIKAENQFVSEKK